MENISENNLCITSYNSTGFGLHQQKYIETLLLFSDILCIQEHFLLDAKDKNHSNTNKIRKVFGNSHDMFVVPAFKDVENVSKGRGKGGLSIMWKKKLTKYVSKIPCVNFRILAGKFLLPATSLLVINAYFMCDPRNDNFDDAELTNLLDDIRNIIRDSNCRSLLLGGDLNCDFSRNTKFVEIVRQAFSDFNLTFFWLNPTETIPAVDFTFSQTIRGNASRSTIDHFADNFAVLNRIVEAGVIHSVDNLSNHSPIFCKIDIGEIDNEIEEVTHCPKPRWAEAGFEDIEKYKVDLGDKLGKIEVPGCVYCQNLECKQHDNLIEDYCKEVLESIDTDAKDNLPMSGKSGGSRRGNGDILPGWNEHVGPYQKEAKFWYSVWESSGKPEAGNLFQIMKESKMQYKYAVRRLKRARNFIQNDKFVQDLLKEGKNIFGEIKKFRGKSRVCSSTIDGVVGSVNIAEHFAGIYKDLYTQVELDDEFEELSEEIKSKIDQSDHTVIEKVNDNLIKEALKRMKAGKSDSLYDYSSECFINGPDLLIPHLINLVKLFLIHGRVPDFLIACSLIPIVKDNLGDPSTSDNYRAIAIGSLLLKLFDWVVLLVEGDKLHVDQLQYGYQALPCAPGPWLRQLSITTLEGELFMVVPWTAPRHLIWLSGHSCSISFWIKESLQCS